MSRTKDKKPVGDKVPSDFEIRSMVHRLFHLSLNQELPNIAARLASQLRVKNDAALSAHVRGRLNALVREGHIRRIRFLPGRPAYTI